ncbi:tyrosine-type recombinase/integrase [Endozoicomonas lisbonensis]|uniref:Site-specific recombinase XerD n=1 Tax=Endozoicomonas lisbonensis TaxID=3120522 RepID=A0ABV2SGS6_9GAMM
MSRKLFSKRGDKWVGEFPPEGGWEKGRRGVRRTLCSVDSLSHLSDMDKQLKLMELYQEQGRKIQRASEAEKAERAKKQQAKNNWTVQQASRVWLDEVKIHRSEETVKSYKNTIKYYIQANQNHRVRDYDKEHEVKFLKHLKTLPGKSGKLMAVTSQNVHARQLRVFLRWCFYDQRILKHKPKVNAPKVKKKDMKTLELSELEKLKQFIISEYKRGLAKRSEDLTGRQRADNERLIRDMRNLLRAYMVATQSLLRLGAIWQLPLNCIDMKRRIIKIRDNEELGWENKKDKWPDKPINDELYEFLEKDLAERNENEKYWLDKGDGRQWYSDTSDVSSQATRACRAAGLPKLKPFHWGMRATMITQLLLNGTDPYSVQQLADHDSISTTMLYLDGRKVQQKNAADAAARLSKSVTKVSQDDSDNQEPL